MRGWDLNVDTVGGHGYGHAQVMGYLVHNAQFCLALYIYHCDNLGFNLETVCDFKNVDSTLEGGSGTGTGRKVESVEPQCIPKRASL